MTSTQPQKKSSNQQSLKKALKGFDRKKLIELAQAVQTLEAMKGDKGPQNDDELWQWMKDELNLEMPRNAVTEGHKTPFDLIADLYFQRTYAAFGLASRGGSKTFAAAVVHVLNGKYKKDFDAITVGAIMAQSNRAYEHFTKLMRRFDGAVKSSTITRTRFLLGGILEIVAGTISAVNGPHVQLMHLDEIELMDPQVLQEALQIPVAKKLDDGSYYQPQVVITSTRKRPGGPVQKILDGIEDSISKGEQPQYDLYKWNVYDVSQRVPNCRIANPDLPEDQKCQCHKVVSGKWDDGSPRRFDQACGGKLGRSEGWITLEDNHNTFRTSNRDIWEAQQECKKPSKEGLVYPLFNKELHGVRGYEPWPEFGPIYTGIDVGSTNPNAVEWIQVLNQPVKVMRYDNTEIEMPEGSHVIFDEIYQAEISNTELAGLIVAKENYYRANFEGWEVADRFVDPAGKAARLELRKYKPAIFTHFYATREPEEHIKVQKHLIENDLLYVDLENAPMFVEEIEVYRYEEPKPGDLDKPVKPVKEFDHALDAARYGIANIYMIELKRAKYAHAAPSSASRGLGRTIKKFNPKASDMGTEPWRKKMTGLPVGKYNGRR